MEFLLDPTEPAHLVCSLTDRDESATVTASNLGAADELLAALADARDSGYGECLWEEQAGQYRWMLRRDGERLTVVVLWSTGTVTGWQHVFRSEDDFEAFASSVRRELAMRGDH